MRVSLVAAGVTVLAGAWIGPLPALAVQSFWAHMTMHMLVVAVAAPLLAAGVAGTRADPARAYPLLLVPVQASLAELVIVWAWHMPALHQAARHEAGALVLEQGSFLAAALWLWIAAVGGAREQHRAHAGAGAFGLLLTSMHMTLLGALLALASRPLYEHHAGAGGMSPLADQHLGGVIMLIGGSTAYLIGGLLLTRGLLRDRAQTERSA